MPRVEADRALGGLVDALAAGGLVVASAGEVRATLDCRPYADDDHDWWVVSDLTPGLDGEPIRVDAGLTPSTWSGATRMSWPSSPGVRSLTTHQSWSSSA